MGYMSRLLVSSELDPASVNIRKALLSMGGWDVCGDGTAFLRNGDFVMMTISESEVHAECIDAKVEAQSFRVDDVVFLSRHSSASKTPTLTVHPIGNYKDAELGGRHGTLVKASPGYMTDAFRKLAAKNDTTEFATSFEATHHGPWLDKPTFFIEIGSDSDHWSDPHAGRIIAETIMCNESSDNPVAFGVGGGHYAPRFSEIALGYRIDFGHFLPTYQLSNASDEDVVRMATLASDATGSKTFYLHRKSFKKIEATRISDILSSAGFEGVSSKDLEPINGS